MIPKTLIADRWQVLLWQTLLTIALALCALATPGFAQDASLSAPSADVERLTQSLVALDARYRRASAAEQPRLLAQLIDTAANRQALLAEFIERDPGQVLRLTLPKRIRARLPQAVREMVEQRLTLEGTLQVLVEDYMDGSHRMRHLLRTEFGERFSLHVASPPPSLVYGRRVRVDGVLVDPVDDAGPDGALAVPSGDENIQFLAPDGALAVDAMETSAAPLDNTFGAQRTVVLLVNFPQRLEEPWTVEDARAVVFGDASDFFRENSSDQTWLEGDVYGWITIDLDVAASCPTMDIALEAQRAAEAQGIDLSGYKRFLYAFPDIGCPWGGEATVGAYPSHAWFDGTLMSAGVVTHEVGHNFGLHHSHSLECGPEVVADGCASLEYGDVLDRMGSSAGGGHFNAFQKRRLGWLDFGASPPTVDADVSGSYALEPYALTAYGPKAVRVLRDENAATGQRRWYYLEFRQPLGFDGHLSTSPYGQSVLNGIVLRLGTEDEPNSSYLLDVTPNTQKYDWRDLALSLGETFTDAASGVSITTDWVDRSGATVTVDFAEPQCVRAKPQVTVSPLQSAWVPPGAAFSYDLTITNGDNEACAEAQFDLSTSVPSGWTAALESESLLLAPGATGSSVVTVTSTTMAEDGFYDIVFTAENVADPTYAGTASATHIVSAAAANSAPRPLDDAATTSIDTPVVIDVLANDTDPDGDPLDVTTLSPGKYGAASINPDGTLTYLPGVRFKGTDTFSYRVSDGVATGDAVVSVTVRKNGGKGGGRKGKDTGP